MDIIFWYPLIFEIELYFFCIQAWSMITTELNISNLGSLRDRSALLSNYSLLKFCRKSVRKLIPCRSRIRVAFSLQSTFFSLQSNDRDFFRTSFGQNQVNRRKFYEELGLPSFQKKYNLKLTGWKLKSKRFWIMVYD